MIHSRNHQGGGFFKSIMLAYMILGLHLLLVAGIILLVIFIRGVVNYMLWIFLGGLLVVLGSAVMFYRKMRTQGKSLKETLTSPVFADRPVELSLLGGLASLRIGGERFSGPARIAEAPAPVYRLEDPKTVRIRELEALANLLEKNLITLDEYNLEKHRLLSDNDELRTVSS